MPSVGSNLAAARVLKVILEVNHGHAQVTSTRKLALHRKATKARANDDHLFLMCRFPKHAGDWRPEQLRQHQ